MIKEGCSNKKITSVLIQGIKTQDLDHQWSCPLSSLVEPLGETTSTEI